MSAIGGPIRQQAAQKLPFDTEKSQHKAEVPERPVETGPIWLWRFVTLNQHNGPRCNLNLKSLPSMLCGLEQRLERQITPQCFECRIVPGKKWIVNEASVDCDLQPMDRRLARAC